MGFTDRLKHAFNAIRSNESREQNQGAFSYGPMTTYRSQRSYPTLGGGDRSITAAVYNRLAMDVAAVELRHVKNDEQGRYQQDVQSGLNERLTLEANLDQGARAFRQDIAQTLFDEGVCAIVPVETSGDPILSASYDIRELRVGTILQWFPQHVRVRVLDQNDGKNKEITLPKRSVAIIENPFYAVMNEPNGTLKRLTRKLNLLDAVDEQSSSGKLDMIIQLPYTIRTETKEAQALKRRESLENQMKDSKYGIGYIDATEKITQLNRPVENNMLQQVEYLWEMLYAQIGVSQEVFKGTATPVQMLNYQNRTVEPILVAIAEGMKRAFISRTARTQGQSIEFYQDMFKFLPVDQLAEIADKFTRNEVLTANEVRGIVGMRPVSDPKADQLVNSNMPIDKTGVGVASATGDPAAPPADDSGFNDILANMEKDIMGTLDGVGADE